MRKARTYDKQTGAATGTKQAAEITEATRHAFVYHCADERCDADHHWVKPHRRKENLIQVSASFARNKDSVHRDGCPYDLPARLKNYKGLAFLQDGYVHLRINFPLGSGFADRYAKPGYLTGAQRRAAAGRTAEKGVPNLQELLRFIDRELGGPDHDALDELALHYQGETYYWADSYAGMGHYATLYDAAHDRRRDGTRPVIAVVQPLEPAGLTRKGKPQFRCAFREAATGHGIEKIAPLLVCETEDTAAMARDAIRAGDRLALTTRPFIADHVKYDDTRKNVPVYAYVHTPSQMVRLPRDDWRFAPPGFQAALDF